MFAYEHTYYNLLRGIPTKLGPVREISHLNVALSRIFSPFKYYVFNLEDVFGIVEDIEIMSLSCKRVFQVRGLPG